MLKVTCTALKYLAEPEPAQLVVLKGRGNIKGIQGNSKATTRKGSDFVTSVSYINDKAAA